jgi:hypothetical protein
MNEGAGPVAAKALLGLGPAASQTLVRAGAAAPPAGSQTLVRAGTPRREGGPAAAAGYAGDGEPPGEPAQAPVPASGLLLLLL